jgi:hypothetical protein
MPLTTESRVIYTEVVPRRRLDFIPGVKSYQVPTTVEFEASPHDMRMVLTFEAMHNEDWTKMALIGRERVSSANWRSSSRHEHQPA